MLKFIVLLRTSYLLSLTLAFVPSLSLNFNCLLSKNLKTPIQNFPFQQPKKFQHAQCRVPVDERQCSRNVVHFVRSGDTDDNADTDTDDDTDDDANNANIDTKATDILKSSLKDNAVSDIQARTNRIEADSYDASGGKTVRNFLYFTIKSDDEQQSQVEKMVVNEGDDIIDIKKAIKTENSNTLALFDRFQILAFESEETLKNETSLDARVEWNKDVQWGTKDKPLIIRAPSLIPSSWDRNPEQVAIGQRFIDSIMGDYEDIPNSYGMKVLRDVIGLETKEAENVVIRSITENFWLKVIEKSETFRVCALGTPGVGKTTTTCILIRLLLLQNKTVVYRVRSLEKITNVYMFTPTLEKSVTVKVIQEDKLNYLSKEINQPSTYYVVDPGETKDSCNTVPEFKGKTIIVASPDDKHWGGSEFFKKRGSKKGLFRFFDAWDLNELLYARQYINSNLTEADIEDRYQDIGGIPRYIFADQETFDNNLLLQTLAINKLTAEQVRSIFLGSIDSTQTFGSHEPTSPIMVYKCRDSNFKDYTVVCASRRVARLLADTHEKILWNMILAKGGARGTDTWTLFENICHNRMLGENSHGNRYEYMYHDGIGLKDDLDPLILLGNCTGIKGTRESLIVAANRSERVIYYSLDPTYPLIDFVYREGNSLHAFQVTIGKDHSCNSTKLMIAIQEAESSKNEFILHYLPFESNYDSFKLEPVNPFEKNKKINVTSSLSNNWTITIVRVPSPDEDVQGRPMIRKTNTLTRKTKPELQQILRSMNLSDSGNRDELIERINEAS